MNNLILISDDKNIQKQKNINHHKVFSSIIILLQSIKLLIESFESESHRENNEEDNDIKLIFKLQKLLILSLTKINPWILKYSKIDFEFSEFSIILMEEFYKCFIFAMKITMINNNPSQLQLQLKSTLENSDIEINNKDSSQFEKELFLNPIMIQNLRYKCYESLEIHLINKNILINTENQLQKIRWDCSVINIKIQMILEIFNDDKICPCKLFQI